MHELEDLVGKHVVFLSWRDTRTPEGGGAERFLEEMAAGLVDLGCRVTIFCAAHAAAPPDEVVDGVRFVRRGSKLGVYARGMWALARRELGHVDLVVDIQNGVPFFSTLVTRRPVVVLVHHVHREQWPVLFPGPMARVGWWMERTVAPRVYRRCQYVAVSRATRDELVELGVSRDRIAVVHNGTETTMRAVTPRAPYPMVAVVGRLVPHKQVEHAIDAVLALRERHPGLRLHVVGGGWWEAELKEYCTMLGAESAVVFEGHVDEARKHQVYAQAWLLALPSIKEGWGLVVSEAGVHATPAVAYASAGGTRESITHGRSGLLVADRTGFEDAMDRILADVDLRSSLGAGARQKCDDYTWAHAQQSFAVVLDAALLGRHVDEQDPEDEILA